MVPRVCAPFATVPHRGARFDYAASPRGSRWDMDLIAVAIVVALGAVGLAWIVFADRI
jgi:hypothetical protein